MLIFESNSEKTFKIRIKFPQNSQIFQFYSSMVFIDLQLIGTGTKCGLGSRRMRRGADHPAVPEVYGRLHR